MAGIPQLRAAGWFVTGQERPHRSEHLSYHLLVRLWEHMDGSGVWSVSLHDCAAPAGHGRVERRYGSEDAARTALAAMYALARHLPPLPTMPPLGQTEPNHELGRWQISEDRQSGAGEVGTAGH
ncbi:hypothetical protein [Pilimelia columellifera]|uniref:Uncharacterized protein n=1 Tax=Pilimelia columellifera subsp. columellifera TaxID=706583 RepID=A0ABP6B3R5_9ACTN